MKITILLPPYVDHPVGGLMVPYEYANRLTARGHTVAVIHGTPGKELRTVLGMSLPEEVKPPQRHWFAIDPRVRMHYVAEFDFEHIPDADVMFNGNVVGAPKEKGMPVVLVQGWGVFPEQFENLVVTKPSGKLCTSRWLCDLMKQLGVPSDQVAYIPNGLDHHTFRLSTPLERRPKRVAMLYGMTWHKGTDVGIEALVRLRALVPGVEAVMFGPAPRSSVVPPWIDYQELPSRETLAREVYNASSVFICPSRSEGFYLCGPEAMACGCAFVSTDIPGIRDYAVDGVTALLAPVDDAGAIAERARNLLEDDELRMRLATAGMDRAGQFSWERSTDLLDAQLARWRSEQDGATT